MKQLMGRYFYALDLDNALNSVCTACHQCNALKNVPTQFHPHSTTDPPDKIGVSFSVDIMRRYRQCVLVLHETVSSYTFTSLVDNERHETLHNAILILCADVRSLGDGGNIIRVDPAPGLMSLVND